MGIGLSETTPRIFQIVARKWNRKNIDKTKYC